MKAILNFIKQKIFIEKKTPPKCISFISGFSGYGDDSLSDTYELFNKETYVCEGCEGGQNLPQPIDVVYANAFNSFTVREQRVCPICRGTGSYSIESWILKDEVRRQYGMSPFWCAACGNWLGRNWMCDECGTDGIKYEE